MYLETDFFNLLNLFLNDFVALLKPFLKGNWLSKQPFPQPTNLKGEENVILEMY